jgi:hypothetical protein
MGPKFTDITLNKIDAFRWKWVLERLSVFDLFGVYDDVQCPALARPDEISLDIKLYQVSHAYRRHQQNLDGNGQLSPHCPSLQIPMCTGLAHQLVRKLQQRNDVSTVIESSQPRPINFRKPASTRCEAANDASHLIQMVLFDAHMMSGDGLQAARKIGDCGRGGAAPAVEKEAQSVPEGLDLDEIPQRGERCRIVSLAYQGRGEGANLPFSVSDSRWPHRPKWRVLQ